MQQGLVERTVSWTDGRGRVIALTAKGREVQEQLHPQHLANEERLSPPSTRRSVVSSVGLLSKLLVSLED